MTDSQNLLAPSAQRYQGAWAEINARLQSRQNVGVVYLTATTAILGASMAGPGTVPSELSWRLPFVVLLPIFSMAVSRWIRHNDAIIGLLSAYCASLEEVETWPAVPGWHNKKHGFIKAALEYRLWTDHATAILAVVSLFPSIALSVVGLGTVIGRFVPSVALPVPSGFGLEPPLSGAWLLACIASALMGLAALVTLAENAEVRTDYLERHGFEKRNELYAYWRLQSPAPRSTWDRCKNIVSFLRGAFLPPRVPEKSPLGAQLTAQVVENSAPPAEDVKDTSSEVGDDISNSAQPPVPVSQPRRLGFPGILALIAPRSFAERLAFADHEVELSRNEGLRNAPLDAKKRQLDAAHAATLDRLLLLRRRILSSFMLMASAALVGLLLRKFYAGPMLPRTVFAGGSLLLFALATLGRLGWAGQSIKGDTSVERLDQRAFQVLYWIGMCWGILAIF